MKILLSTSTPSPIPPNRSLWFGSGSVVRGGRSTREEATQEGLKLVAMESEATEAHKSEKSSSAVGGKLLNCSHCATHRLSVGQQLSWT